MPTATCHCCSHIHWLLITSLKSICLWHRVLWLLLDWISLHSSSHIWILSLSCHKIIHSSQIHLIRLSHAHHLRIHSSCILLAHHHLLHHHLLLELSLLICIRIIISCIKSTKVRYKLRLFLLLNRLLCRQLLLLRHSLNHRLTKVLYLRLSIICRGRIEIENVVLLLL